MKNSFITELDRWVKETIEYMIPTPLDYEGDFFFQIWLQKDHKIDRKIREKRN